jgi:hypothetical protein
LTLQKAIILQKIVFKPLQTNLFNIVLLSFFLSMGCTLYAQEISQKKTTNCLKQGLVKVTKKDLERKVKDSIPSDTIIKGNKKLKKAFLEGKVRCR